MIVKLSYTLVTRARRTGRETSDCNSRARLGRALQDLFIRSAVQLRFSAHRNLRSALPPWAPPGVGYSNVFTTTSRSPVNFNKRMDHYKIDFNSSFQRLYFIQRSTLFSALSLTSVHSAQRAAGRGLLLLFSLWEAIYRPTPLECGSGLTFRHIQAGATAGGPRDRPEGTA